LNLDWSRLGTYKGTKGTKKTMQNELLSFVTFVSFVVFVINFSGVLKSAGREGRASV
jgi:hypothetical protein